MARRHAHEEHANHEAWAIPYGDLVTLLLAFFVVMYAISSVNEGKYRVLSDSLSEAFGGPQRTLRPVQPGQSGTGSAPPEPTAPISLRARAQLPSTPAPLRDWPARPRVAAGGEAASADAAAHAREQRQLDDVTARIERALGPLVEKRLVRVRRTEQWLEIEISSDLLFASGQAVPSPAAVTTLRNLAATVRALPNPLRVEGHTDDVPIHSVAFPSNWELSAARAAAVLRLFVGDGVDPDRLSVVGYGPYRPLRDNGDDEGRAANRRVVLVVLAAPAGAAPGDPAPAPAFPSALAADGGARVPPTFPRGAP